jgi:soluble lytic murein transglycosylase-like protein
MRTIFQWLFGFLFLNFCGVAYAPLGEPPSYPAMTVLTVQDIIRYAHQLDFFDPKLIASIAKIESDYQPEAQSVYKGIIYYGLMQMSYETARMVGFRGHPQELMDWRVNMKYASRYLEQLMHEHGTLPKTVAAYNAGTVYYCQRKCPKGEMVNATYVSNVMRVYQELKGS